MYIWSFLDEAAIATNWPTVLYILDEVSTAGALAYAITEPSPTNQPIALQRSKYRQPSPKLKHSKLEEISN